MQIRPASVRLVQLNFGLSMYLNRTFGLSLSLSLSLSGNFGLRPKFRLSEITSLFDLSLVLDRTLAQRKAQRKAKSKSEVALCPIVYWHVVSMQETLSGSCFFPECDSSHARCVERCGRHVWNIASSCGAFRSQVAKHFTQSTWLHRS